MEDKKLDIVAVKTKEGKYYLTEKTTIGASYNHSRLGVFLFDGKEPSNTFHKEWICVDSKPKLITQMVKQPNINHRYELQDKALISDKLPEFIDRESVATYLDYEWAWNDGMRQYRSLYKEISDVQPDKKLVYGFDLEVALTVEKIIDPVKMNYKVPRTQWKHEGFTKIDEQSVHYQLADKVILPHIVLPQRPCSLTSPQTYKIVRQYISDNINPELAKITSDYDFCFTVKRRIKLGKVINYTVDVNNSIFTKRKKKPRYVQRQQREKEVECFEMTHSDKNYQGYTPIKGFQADNQKELKEKIDAYCKEVINFINTPLIECPHCCGDGIVHIKKEGVGHD